MISEIVIHLQEKVVEKALEKDLEAGLDNTSGIAAIASSKASFESSASSVVLAELPPSSRSKDNPAKGSVSINQ